MLNVDFVLSATATNKNNNNTGFNKSVVNLYNEISRLTEVPEKNES